MTDMNTVMEFLLPNGEIDKRTQRRKPTNSRRRLRYRNQSISRLPGPIKPERIFKSPFTISPRLEPCMMTGGRFLTYRSRPWSVITAALFSFSNYVPKILDDDKGKGNDVITSHRLAS